MYYKYVLINYIHTYIKILTLTLDKDLPSSMWLLKGKEWGKS